MNRHQAVAALAAADPVAGIARPAHEAGATIEVLTMSAESDVRPQAETVPLVAPPAPLGKGATRRRSALLAVAVLVVVLVAGGLIVQQVVHRTAAPPSTGGTSVAPSPSMSPPFTPDQQDHLKASTELLGVQLQPPTDTPPPKISSTGAEALCNAPAVGCLDAGPLTTVLAVATADAPAQIQPDGSEKRMIENRLVWAISWPGTCIAYGGPVIARSGSPSQPPRTPEPCTYLALFDANSGAALFLASGTG